MSRTFIVSYPNVAPEIGTAESFKMNELDNETSVRWGQCHGVIINVLRGAGWATGAASGISIDDLWDAVRSDSLAAAYFLRCISKQLLVGADDDILQCKSVSEVVDVVTKRRDSLGTGVKVVDMSLEPGQLQTASSNRVAIVGVSCRLPGDVTCLSELWTKVLLEERDAIVPVPAERWNNEALFDSEGGEGTLYVSEGGFIKDADAFDNRFFDIHDNEVGFRQEYVMFPRSVLSLSETFGSHHNANDIHRRLRWIHNSDYFFMPPLKRWCLLESCVIRESFVQLACLLVLRPQTGELGCF